MGLTDKALIQLNNMSRKVQQYSQEDNAYYSKYCKTKSKHLTATLQNQTLKQIHRLRNKLIIAEHKKTCVHIKSIQLNQA